MRIPTSIIFTTICNDMAQELLFTQFVKSEIVVLDENNLFEEEAIIASLSS